jgi:hypothetical protein
MSQNLSDVVTQIQTIVGTVAGIRQAPAYPPDSINVFPFAVAFPASGEIVRNSVASKIELHTVRLEVHVARKDLERDIATVINYGRLIPSALLATDALTLGGHVTTITGITYTFGPLGYADTETVGYTFDINYKLMSS